MKTANFIILFPAAILLVLFGCRWKQPESIPENEVGGARLPATRPLTLKGDIASHLVDGVDRFLLREIEKSIERRAKYWNRDFSSAQSYNKSLEPNRKRLSQIIGVRDERVQFDSLEMVATTRQPALVGRGDGYEIYSVRWPAFGDVHGEGLLLTPHNSSKVADIIAIPDADQTPEQIAGLAEGVAVQSQYARRLAESGCQVLVPVLINRTIEKRYPPERGDGNRLSNREFLYRSAFELGRHIIGYEVQKVLAAVDWFIKDANSTEAKIGVIGWGQGGLLALYSGALDSRIDTVVVSGYFEPRQNIWQETLDRNIFGLLEQFGDAELASMIAPRPLIIEAVKGPELLLPVRTKDNLTYAGGPGRLVTPKLEDVRREAERAKRLVDKLKPPPRIELIVSDNGTGPYGTAKTLAAMLNSLSPGARLAQSGKPLQRLCQKFDPKGRQHRQIHEIDHHNQWLLRESPYVRDKFFSKADTSSLAKFQETIEWYRDYFYNEVIGRFDYKPLPFNVRSRKAYEKEKWNCYEVVLDVFPDVIGYGFLIVPKDIKKGERRPVVVCQHGLSGRPRVTFMGNNPAYSDFAAKLAERGFITFAPQNLYVGPFGDRFRTLQRKGNAIKKTLFSIIVPQHQQILDWLASLPYVDPDRIGFYGLSYGGKTAMRVPPLVDGYCLAICSGDFNDWIRKNASSRNKCSYIWYHEYEIFEFDLGSTFNYAEMAALIAPRPFMVERGHFDLCAPDQWVGYEYARVRRLYNLLRIGDKTEIEFFVGPHAIHGVGTFEFLHKHLNWPELK